MQSIAVQIPDQIVSRLEQAAKKLGLTVEQLLQISLEEKLARLDEEFQTAAEHVLNKNDELYKRLA